MPTWTRDAEDAAEVEHPSPKEPHDKPKFRPAWGPALIVLLELVLVGWMIATGWTLFGS